MADNFRRALTIGTSLIAGSFLIFGLSAYFISGAISAKADKISKDRNTIRSHSELIGGLAKQKATSPEIVRFEQAIALMLPPKDQLGNFSGWLDGLSRAHNINTNFNFTGETVSPTASDAGYIRFALSASGDYAGLMNFLRDIELKSPKYTVSLDDFDIKRSGNNYTVATNGRVFFR